MFIYSYQQHDHLLPGNDRMLVIGSSALAKNHGHLKSSRLAADTLIFNFPLNHPRLWRQMEHSLSGARYSIILFMWPPLHLSPANGRLMEKPPEGGGPMESAEDMLCRLFAFLRKQTRRLILLSSPPSDYGSARHPYAEEPGVLEAWNALLRTLAGKLNLPFIDFCGDMLQYRPLPGSGEEDFPEAYRNLGKQILHRLPFGQTWVRRRSGKIHRLLEKRRKRRKERMLARWRTLAAPPHYREETDWITAIHSEKGQARILLIGDSVMRHLWRPLASELQEDIDLFSSTLIPGDPDYLPTLAGYFPSAGYEAVIVSFGSHVTNKVSAISVDDFRKNYMAFVSQLSKRCRFLLLAGDVAELYFSDLRGASVAAAGDGLALWSIEKGTMHPHLEYMGNYLSSPLSYCNSGVLVLDLDQMRRRNLEHRLLQWLRSRPEPFPYPDQDILNIALHGDITPLPPEWNFQFLSWTWDEEKTRLLRGTEFENVPSISCGRSWKLLHMVGPEKPWRLPDAPGTMGQFHWILYSFFWWPEAKKLPAFRKELDAISQGLAPLLRRHIRGQQWKLFFSRGHIFRKRRDKIRWLKKLLSILDGRKP